MTPISRFMTIKQQAQNCLAVVLGFCFCLSAFAQKPGEGTSKPLRSGFEQRMQAWVNLRYDEIELGELLHQVSQKYDVPICLDRRVDPHRVVSLIIKDQSLGNAVQRLAKLSGLHLAKIGETVFFSEDERASLLPSRIRQLKAELKGPPLKLSSKRTIALFKPTDFAWDDFVTTEEVVSSLEARGPMKLLNKEQLAYDVLAARHLEQVSHLEAAVLFAFQFGKNVTPSSKMTRELAIFEFNELPTLAQWAQDVAAYADEQAPSTTRRVVPLSKREFTLKVQQARARDILQAIIDSGVEVNCDEESLSNAGVDLTKPISLDVSKATIEELMRQICDPIGANYSISDEAVEVRAPK